MRVRRSAARWPGQYRTGGKIPFLTQSNFGFDVAVFPRVILPSASQQVGDQHASFLLPIWLEKDWVSGPHSAAAVANTISRGFAKLLRGRLV